MVGREGRFCAAESVGDERWEASNIRRVAAAIPKGFQVGANNAKPPPESMTCGS